MEHFEGSGGNRERISRRQQSIKGDYREMTGIEESWVISYLTYSQSGCIVCDRTLVEICCKRLCTFLSSDQNRHLSRVIIQTG